MKKRPLAAAAGAAPCMAANAAASLTPTALTAPAGSGSGGNNVPESGSLALFAIGVAGFAARRRTA